MNSKKTAYQLFAELDTIPENWRKISDLAVKKVYKKGDVLSFAHTKSKYIYFLEEGIVRKFYTHIDGKEHNKIIYTDNHIAGCFDSLFTGDLSVFSLDCLSPVVIYEVDFEELLMVLKKYPNLKELYHQFMMQLFIISENMMVQMTALSTTERYLFFMKNAKTKYKIPLYHIASYLGITAIQLSRIRKVLSS